MAQDLPEEIQQRLMHTETLLAVAQAIGSTLDLTETMRRVARETARALGADMVGAYVVDPDHAAIRPVAGYRVPKHLLDDFLKFPIPLKGHRFLEEAWERQEAVFSSHVGADPRRDPDCVGRFPHRSALFVPMIIKGEFFGGFYAVWWEREVTLTPGQLRLVEGISRQAAIALENARLYEESRQAYEELSQTKDQLAQVQKLEAVGRLAGGISHDFNNLLTVIIGRVDFLLNHFEQDDPRLRQIDLIGRTARRAAALTHQLLAFSRKQVLQPKVLDLRGVVGSMDAMLRRLIGEDIDLLTVLPPGVGRVKADPGQLEQVILNLAVNARDAMPQGGRLTLETANIELDETYASRHVGARPGRYVMLAVSDTGCGMNAETQARAFEPFFTTKEAGVGTGLGLATVYGIVKQSGGNVWVYSEPGRGTTFKIYLPRVEDAPEAAAPPARPAAPGQGSETVLLVEDEAELRALASEILQGQGYAVLEAADGVEGAVVAERHPGAIHLLVTDVVMPRKSGRELAESLRSARPETKVIYMSGYTDDAIIHHGVLEPGIVLLEKPFTPDALLGRVREVLDAPEAVAV